MKRYLLLFAALLIFAGCKMEEPSQEDVNAVMDMAIEVYYAGTFAHKYEQIYEGFEVQQNEDNKEIHITLNDLILKDFYEELYIEGEPPCTSISGTIDMTAEGTMGNLTLKGGKVKTLEFSNAGGVSIKANGYEFSGITD